MVIEAKTQAEEKELFPCRRVLWHLTFYGFLVYAMLETSVSLTIIGMVVPRPTAAVVAQCEPRMQMPSDLSNSVANASATTISKEHSLAKISTLPLELTSTVGVSMQHHDRYPWNEYEQGLVLGGYFWTHWILHMPSGLLARRYGTKIIFGWANLLTALVGFLIPLCARYHLYAFVALRAAQGFSSGLAWPSMHNMAAKWIPVTERSEFMSAYQGSSVGTAIGSLINAALINWFGWAWVFYVTSALGVIWYVAWYCLAYDTPQKHPRISNSERTYILEHLGDSVDHSVAKPVPWKAILTSGPVWLVAIAHAGCGFGTLVMGSEAPSYFNYIHGWNITAVGVLAAAPHLARMIFSYTFARLADWILRTKRMTTTRLRKFAIFISNGIPCILVLGLAYSGCHSYLAIIFIILGTTSSGAATAGTFSCAIDLSPNYASVLFGISSVCVAVGAFIGPMMVGVLTNNNQTIEQWRLVFLIVSAIVFSTCLPYILFGTSDRQPWNNGVGHDKKQEDELRELRSKSDDVRHDEAIEVTEKCENDATLT